MSKGDHLKDKDIREKIRAARHETAVFNRYLKAIKRRPGRPAKETVQELEAALQRGTKLRKVPVGGGRGKSGPRMCEVREVPLQPADRAKLLGKLRRLRSKPGVEGFYGLRAEFLLVLPGVATRLGVTVEDLLELGVPQPDLEAAGLAEPF